VRQLKATNLLDRKHYDEFRVSPTDPATIRVADVERILAALAPASAGRLRVEKFADSFEGRPISLAALGTGPKRVLMWSQMHGDEPTHTAVVLDLISYLLRTPAAPFATEILASCTLHIIPLLNPDGAERVSRFNAQDIDVNRDARRLATPEGRALRRAVETLRPDFGFNLHNQNARTAVGTPPKPAAVSVLAPSLDAAATQTPQMRRAKQVAAAFVQAVRTDAEGMISRYDDEFEPRAFGDTIQAMGCATILVEAGGWPGPDPEPLVRLHFHGILATLHAIATDKLGDIDLKLYESLPQSNSRPLIDCMITGGNLLDAKNGEPYTADLGIDHSHGSRLAITSKRDGRIVDVGDLSTTAGKVTIDANGHLVLSGRVTFVNDWLPGAALSDDRLNTLLTSGTTSVIGFVDLADRDAVESIDRDRELPINWGFVGRLESARSLPPARLVEHVALAAAHGVLAVVGEHADESFWQKLDDWGVPLLQMNQLPPHNNFRGSYRELAQQNFTVHRLLDLAGNRGKLARGSCADLQLFKLSTDVNAAHAVDWRKLSRVIVAGETVWENGHRTGGKPGAFLRRSK
jgi:predicted deacylase